MTEKQKVGWKVVSRDRTSCIMFGNAGTVLYRKRRKTVPKALCGPLCIFTSKHAAWIFKGDRDDKHVLRCCYKPSKTKKIWIGKDSVGMLFLPYGTALADSVTCLE